MTMRLIHRPHLLLALTVLTIVGRPVSAADAPATRPNLLFVLSDDQRWDTMGCAGNRVIRTPHLDQLAADGVRFRNAFVTTAICAASRASILTGLYERTHRYTFGTPPIRPAHVADSYPAVLKRAGYRTGFVGKFGVGVEKQATAELFDSFVPLNPPYIKKQRDGSERHLTDLEADAAVRFLDSVKPGEPFCLSVSFNAPHAEDNNPRQYAWTRETDALYADDVIPPPPSMSDDVFRAQQPFLQKSESRVRFNWRFDEPAKYQAMVKGYYRMISGVDAAVGRLRAELARRGLAGDTVIVYTSDNGYFLGERGFADKWYIYDPSVRVPLIVYDPRAAKTAAGRTAEAVALNLDVAPTLLDFAGVPAPAGYRGRTLSGRCSRATLQPIGARISFTNTCSTGRTSPRAKASAGRGSPTSAGSNSSRSRRSFMTGTPTRTSSATSSPTRPTRRCWPRCAAARTNCGTDTAVCSCRIRRR
jgi:arylsulfatase A-like enzyme